MILRAPDERDGYLVYADWLSEQGDPRGELIATQVALTDKPRDAELRKRADALLEEHEEAWLGELYEKKKVAFGGPFLWHWGFVKRAVLSGPRIARYPQLRKLPAAVALRDLVLLFPKSGASVLALIAAHGLPEALSSFELLGETTGAKGLSMSIEPLLPHLSRLESLSLCGRRIGLGRAIALPSLRWFTLQSQRLERGDIETLAHAKWKLEGFDLLFECEALGDLAFIFEAKGGLSTLKHLGLRNESQRGDLLRELFTAPVLKQIVSLGLTASGLTDDEGRLLIEQKAKLAHLERLVLQDNAFSEDMQKALWKTFGERLEL